MNFHVFDFQLILIFIISDTKKSFETHTTDREDNRRVLRRKEAFYIELYEKARNDQINSQKK